MFADCAVEIFKFGADQTGRQRPHALFRMADGEYSIPDAHRGGIAKVIAGRVGACSICNKAKSNDSLVAMMRAVKRLARSVFGFPVTRSGFKKIEICEYGRWSVESTTTWAFVRIKPSGRIIEPVAPMPVP
jgi:hypothetical protein